MVKLLLDKPPAGPILNAMDQPNSPRVDDGLSPQIGDTRLVVLRFKEQPKRAFHCARCAEQRGVKTSRHFLRIRRDRELNVEWRFWECWACGNRIE